MLLANLAPVAGPVARARGLPPLRRSTPRRPAPLAVARGPAKASFASLPRVGSRAASRLPALSGCASLARLACMNDMIYIPNELESRVRTSRGDGGNVGNGGKGFGGSGGGRGDPSPEGNGDNKHREGARLIATALGASALAWHLAGGAAFAANAKASEQMHARP